MSIMTQFNLDPALFGSVISEPDLLDNNRKTTMFRAGVPTLYKGSINGVAIDAEVTLKSARLTRLSLLQQVQKSTGNQYYLATGVMNPVEFNIDLILDGVKTNIIDFFHGVAQESAGTEISRDAYLLNLSKIGLKWNTGMPLFFQQFGANKDQLDAAVEIMKAHGGRDTKSKMKNNSSFEYAFQLKEGLPISAFEIGTVDRTKSPRFNHDNIGQGFLNLIDAQVEQFSRIVGLRKSAKLKLALATEGNKSEAEIAELKASADLDTQMAGQWTSNWAGAQQRLTQLKEGGFQQGALFDPVNLPCGRFTILEGTTPVEIDLWTQRNKPDLSTVPDSSEPF